MRGHFATITYHGQPLSSTELEALAYMVEHQNQDHFSIPELNRHLGVKSFDPELVSHLLAQLSSSSIEITAPQREQHIELVNRYSIKPPIVKCQFPADFVELVTTGDISQKPS